MAMREADTEATVRDDLGQRKVRGFGVEVALDDLEVRSYGAEVVVGFFVGEVAKAEDLRDFVGGEEFFELEMASSINLNGLCEGSFVGGKGSG